MTGIAMSVEPAMIAAQSVACVACTKAFSHTGSVRVSGLFMMTSANVNSFQAWMNAKTPVAVSPGPSSGRVDAEERPHTRAAVDHRRLLQFDRDAAHESAERPDRERQHRRDVDERQPDDRVDHGPAIEHPEDRHDHRLGRDHLRHEKQHDESAAAAKPEPSQRERREEREHEREHHRRHGDDERGGERRKELDASGRLGHDADEVAQRELVRPEVRNRILHGARRQQGRVHHPVDREDRAHEHDHRDDVEQYANGERCMVSRVHVAHASF